MTSEAVVVLDAGTSVARCVVFDGGGEVVGQAAMPWRYLVEPDSPTMARAFDHETLWHSICELIRRTLHEAEVAADQIVAVAATSQRQAVVFLDASGRELYAGPNIDLRAVFEGAAIDDEHGDLIYRTTGHLPSFFFTPAKLRWFKLHRPDTYGKIARGLPLADWIASRLTGRQAAESTLAAEAGLLDVHTGAWASQLLANLDIRAAEVEIVCAGTIVADVTLEAAQATGLPAGTPLCTAGADTQCGLLGLGVVDFEQIGIVAGWVAPLQMITPKPTLTAGRTWAGRSLIDGRWVLESSPGDLGNSLDWLARLLFGDADDRFSRVDALASASPIGSEGASAFIGPRRMDMTQLGLSQGGLLFPVPLTFSDLGREHLARAFLESCAYAIRANLEQAEEFAGGVAANVSVGGGMTRSAPFVGILADVLGREISVADSANVSALGAYLCAGVALGRYGSMDDAAGSARARLKVIEPDTLNASDYADHYDKWLDISERLGKLDV